MSVRPIMYIVLLHCTEIYACTYYSGCHTVDVTEFGGTYTVQITGKVTDTRV